MRRHRQLSSSSIVTSSNVARPSGLANDQVISRMPGALRTNFTLNDAGHARAGSCAYASLAGANLSLMTDLNVA